MALVVVVSVFLLKNESAVPTRSRVKAKSIVKSLQGTSELDRSDEEESFLLEAAHSTTRPRDQAEKNLINLSRAMAFAFVGLTDDEGDILSKLRTKPKIGIIQSRIIAGYCYLPDKSNNADSRSSL